MTTITRNLTQIDGATVSVPTQNGFSTTSWEVFANDAAYEAVFGAGQQGDAYFNSTELVLRQHNGTAWIYMQNGINALEDSASTGSSQDLDSTYHNLLKLTNASLTSVRSLDPGQTLVVYLVNDTGSDITILHDDAGATAANRLLMPAGENFTLEDASTAHFVYDALASRFRYTNAAGSGGSGTGTGSKNYVLSPDSSTSITDVGGSASVDTTTLADLPEETKGVGVLVTQTAGSIGNTSTWETNAIDDGDGGCNGAPEMYWKTKSGYVDDAASIQWYNSDTATVLYSQDIKAGSGRISKGVADIALTTNENIKPRIYWNVTSETNGLVVSGAGTLAETRLVGYGGEKQYDITDKLNKSTGGTTDLATAKLSKDIAGIWRAEISIIVSGASNVGAHDLTIDGMKWAKAFIAGTASGIASGAYCQTGNASTDPASVVIRYDVATTNIRVSGSFELTEKPTWADFDGSVMFGTEALGLNAKGAFYSTNAQSIPTATWTPVTWATATKDNTIGQWDGTRFTADKTGFLELSCARAWNTTLTTQHYIRINKNSGTIVRQLNHPFSTAVNPSTWISISDVYLELGDYVEVEVLQSEGGNRTFRTTIHENYLDVNWQAERSSKATGFPIAVQNPGEYGVVVANSIIQKIQNTAYSGSGATGILSLTNVPDGKYKVTVGAQYSYRSVSNAQAYIEPQVNGSSVSIGSGTWIIGTDDDGSVETEAYNTGYSGTMIIDLANGTNTFDLDITVTTNGILARPWYILEKLENSTEITTEWN